MGVDAIHRVPGAFTMPLENEYRALKNGLSRGVVGRRTASSGGSADQQTGLGVLWITFAVGVTGVDVAHFRDEYTNIPERGRVSEIGSA